MTALVLAAWAAAWIAWSIASRPPRSVARLDSIAPRRDVEVERGRPRRASLLVRLGDALVARSPRLGEVPSRSLGAALVIVIVLVPWTLLGAALGGALPIVAGVLSARTQRRRRRVEIDRDLILLFQILDLGVGSGCTLRTAIGFAEQHVGGQLGVELGRLTRRLSAGTGLADALDLFGARLEPSQRGLVARVASADRSGSPVGAVLRAAALELRVASRRGAEIRARRLPVLMLLPLVCCVLPAFVVLAIVPMVISGATSFFPS